MAAKFKTKKAQALEAKRIAARRASLRGKIAAKPAATAAETAKRRASLRTDIAKKQAAKPKNVRVAEFATKEARRRELSKAIRKRTSTANVIRANATPTPGAPEPTTTITDEGIQTGTTPPPTTDTGGAEIDTLTQQIEKLKGQIASLGGGISGEQKEFIQATQLGRETEAAAGAKGITGFADVGGAGIQAAQGFAGGVGGTQQLPTGTQDIIQQLGGLAGTAFDVAQRDIQARGEAARDVRAGQIARKAGLLAVDPETGEIGVSEAERKRIEAPFLTKIQRTEERRKASVREFDDRVFEIERKFRRTIEERERFNIGQDIKAQKISGILGTTYDSNAMGNILDARNRGKVALEDLITSKLFTDRQLIGISQAINRDYEISVDEIENNMSNQISERREQLLNDIEDIENSGIKDAKELSDKFQSAFKGYIDRYSDVLKFTNQELVRENARIDKLSSVKNKITKFFTDNRGFVTGFNERGEEIFRSDRPIGPAKKTPGPGGDFLKLTPTQKQDAAILGFSEAEINDPQRRIEILEAVKGGTRTITTPPPALPAGTGATAIGSAIGTGREPTTITKTVPSKTGILDFLLGGQSSVDQQIEQKIGQ